MGNWSVRVVWRRITNREKLPMSLYSKLQQQCVVKIRLTDQILSRFSIVIDIDKNTLCDLNAFHSVHF